MAANCPRSDGPDLWSCALRVRHSGEMVGGIDSRAVAVGAAAVLLATVLGAAAGGSVGVAAGVLSALAGLVAPPVLDMALRRRERNAANVRRRAELLQVFAPPQPGDLVAGAESGELATGRQVSWYLRPENQVVGFRSRPELDLLLNWCIRGGRAGARLVTGDGGTGKTRLALGLGDELTGHGWLALWVPAGREAQAAGVVRELGQPCVLVVDYAETRGGLGRLLAEVADNREGPEVRVVLLARSGGEWWQKLLAGSEERVTALLNAAAPLRLGPVVVAGGVTELFGEAVTAFADRLGVARPDVHWILADPAPVVLVVHAAALLAVLDSTLDSRNGPAAGSGDLVLDGVLRHEARYWQRTAEARGLNLDTSVLRLAIAVGCLIGAGSEPGAVKLLSCIDDLADSAQLRGRLARWLHDLYPDTHGTKAVEWIGPLRPDPVAEHLVVTELRPRSDMIRNLFIGLAEDRAARALSVFARAALTQPDAVDLLRDALTVDLEHLAVAAVSVAVETNAAVGDLLTQALNAEQVSVTALTRIAEAAPYPSFALAEAAATVLQRLVDQCAESSQRAEWLVDLSNRLADLGRPDQALAAAEEAVAIRRELAAAQPDAFLPGLAMSLSTQSNRLGGLGRRDEALAAVEEAVAIRRRLVIAQDHLFLPDLAASLNNQSNRLSDVGRREEALAAIEEAVGIYRRLAAAQADVFLPDLAMSLNNQSRHLGGLGRREESLAAALEAVAIRRELAAERPDAFLPDLARSLTNQSNRLGDAGRPEEALAAIMEAVGIYRRLAAARPDAFLPSLSGALNNQSNRLRDVGRSEEALAAIEEAVVIRRELAAARPDAFLPSLAMSLNNLSVHLSRLRRSEEALAAIEEAVAIRRDLAAARPDAFLPDLAASLNNLSVHLGGLGRPAEAVATIEEATGIYRRLAAARPAAFAPDLAMSLNNQSIRLADLGRLEDAHAAAEQAVAIRRELATARPAIFRLPLARALDQFAEVLSALGRNDRAAAARAEAEDIRRPAATRDQHQPPSSQQNTGNQGQEKG
jgi:tetratricopeptide (TPR) repeat protein